MIWHLDPLTTLRFALLSSLWAAVVVVVPVAGLRARLGLDRTRASHTASRGSLLAFFVAWMATLLAVNVAAAPRFVVNDPATERAWLPSVLSHYATLGPSPEWEAVMPTGLLEGVWLVGVIAAFVRISIDLWSLEGWLRSAEPLSVERVIGDGGTRLEAHMKARGIAVGLSRNVRQPCALGFFRPTVLLPVDFVESFSAPERRALLAHEVAHLDRRDVFKNLALHSLGAILWFNPGFRALRRAYVRSRELACDERACRYLESPVVLARALERAARLEPHPVFALGTLGEGGALLTRVRALVGRSSPLSARRRAACAAVVTTCAIVGVAAAERSAAAYFRDWSRNHYLSAKRLDLDQFTADVCSLLRDDGFYETDRFGGGYGPVSLKVRNRDAIINGVRVPSPTQERLQNIFADHGVRWREETFLRFFQADSEVGIGIGAERLGERIGSGRWLEEVTPDL